MDKELEKEIEELTKRLAGISSDVHSYQLMDPVARLMLVALIHEAQKIRDDLENVSNRILDHFCENFIPRKEVCAMPAIALVSPLFKKGKDSEQITVNSGATFTYKKYGDKTVVDYIPLFQNVLLPYNDVYILTKHKMRSKNQNVEICMDKDNVLWVGINTKAEIESLKNFSLFVKGISGVFPEKISVVSNSVTELRHCSMNRMEDIDMLPPFDAQQATTQMMAIMQNWKENLLDLNDSSLLYITDEIIDRDVFKPKAFPRSFQNWLESEVLDMFNANTVWLRIEYPDGFTVPDDCSVEINVVPVVNVNVNTVTLTQSSPIAKLQKHEDEFFVQVLEASNAQYHQGFFRIEDDIIIRDFDASCYHDGDLYRDISNLYVRFVENYYAFVEYNGLKDGGDITQLKVLIDKIKKSVKDHNSKYNFDSGVYAMKNIHKDSNSLSTKVSYMTTQGALGNILEVFPKDEKERRLESKRMPLIELNVPVVVGAMGGKDKASPDTRYELLHYYTLTDDHLYTKMDVEAFVRKDLIERYGKEEFKRIFIKTRIEGAGGERKLQRGLYIDIEFKDKKNFAKAESECIKDRLKQKICNKSCISMPIIIGIKSLE